MICGHSMKPSSLYIQVIHTEATLPSCVYTMHIFAHYVTRYIFTVHKCDYLINCDSLSQKCLILQCRVHCKVSVT